MKPPKELTGGFRIRPRDADKYLVGTVSVVGGSPRYPCAPVLAALGARAAGAGLVQLFAPEPSRFAAGSLVPEATFSDLSPTGVPPRADVMVVGMGLGVTLETQALVSRLLSGSSGRFVLDADALSILAGWYGQNGSYRPSEGQEVVITPHEGEAARLLGVPRGDVAANRSAAAHAMAERYGATVVLKGPGTLVVAPDGSRAYENETGNPFMALGGMGDLLAGAIGARWAYVKGDAFLAAATAVWLHGAAGDRIVAAGRDPSLANVAAEMGGLRVVLDGAEGFNDRSVQSQKEEGAEKIWL